MKKFLSLALVLVLALTLSLNVFAEEILGGANGSAELPSTSGNIPVSVVLNSSEASTLYKIDIQWESLQFTYTETKSYDVNTHVTTPSGSWNETSADITVYNHSNAPVYATPSITEVQSNGSGIAASLNTTDKTEIGSAAGITDLALTPKATFTVSIEDKRPDTSDTIANVKIALSKN